jgi:ADP-ribose pyrophosphatase YjhB (NUDIX family)
MNSLKRFGRWAHQAAHGVRFAYWCLIRPRTHGVQLIVTKKSRILLVRHTYMDRSCWALPGGGISSGESAPACARRELKEELALDGDFRQLGTVDVTHDFHRDLVRVFLVQNHCGEPKPNEAEIAEVRWFEFDHLPLNLTKLAHHILIDDTGLGWRKMQGASDVASS